MHPHGAQKLGVSGESARSLSCAIRFRTQGALQKRLDYLARGGLRWTWKPDPIVSVLRNCQPTVRIFESPALIRTVRVYLCPSRIRWGMYS